MRASLPLAPPDSAALTQRGLLLRGVLSTAALPAPLREALRSLDATWLDGHARFSVIRQGGQNAACPSPIFGDDPVFRIVQWDDNL